LLTGGVLLLLNCLGYLQPPITPSTAVEAAPTGYYERVRTWNEAQQSFQSLRAATVSHREKARALLDIIFESYLHSREFPYLITPFDNWYLWLRGQMTPRYLQSQDAELLWRRGGGYCDQAAMIYVAKARELGLQAYLAWLEGHVIATVSPEPGVWHLADPDMGMYWEFPIEALGKALSCDDIQQQFLERGYSERLSGKISAIYCSGENNRLTDFPYAKDLAIHEGKASYYKWLLPILLLGLGGLPLHSLFRKLKSA